MSMITDHIAKGNYKLPESTWIFNSCSATDCPSKALGLCQCPEKCYALKAEKQYPNVKPYRDRQLEITKTVSPTDFANDLIASSKRARNPEKKMKAFRFNESGDFADQTQLDWFTSVCKILKAKGIKCYGYTARTDLDLRGLVGVAGVNVSNDGGDWINKGCNRFKAVDCATGDHRVCVGDCRLCSLCVNPIGEIVEVPIH